MKRSLLIPMFTVLCIGTLAAQPLVRLSQESSAGAGDFDSNILGDLEIFDRSGDSPADVYAYSAYSGIGYGGTDITPLEFASQLAVVETASGTALLIVHDAERVYSDVVVTVVMRLLLEGDSDGMHALIRDDDVDGYVTISFNELELSHLMASCCTDGALVGALEGAWTLYASIGVRENLNSWQAQSANGDSFPLAFDPNRRIRLELMVDADGDLVLDNVDACLETPAGAVVDGAGCSIDQLCPCDAEWKNHGKYVSCVTDAVNDFAAWELISGKEKEETVSEAAQSSCGGKK